MHSMSGLGSQFDPELMQGRWVLGGITPEQFVELAIHALEQGFDGTALRQVAGLAKPTTGDLGSLPERVFAEMGLKTIEKDQAVALLLARGQPSTSPVVSALRQAFPDFSDRWKKHVAWWGGNPAGSYNDMAEFVHFVVEDVYEKGKLDETRRIFQLLEQLLEGANDENTNLIGLGFFEKLQNYASWRPQGNKVYEQFFGPISKQIWGELQIMWAGKSSLMDVIRAEQKKKTRLKSRETAFPASGSGLDLRVPICPLTSLQLRGRNLGKD
jgi:hypothetical protein